MRHNRTLRKFSRTQAHRNMMYRNLVTSLFKHERIQTTAPKAKEARAVAERLITFAKKLSLLHAGNRIRVNAIAPGFFMGEQNRYLLTDEKTGELTPRGRTIIDHTPMGRFGDPDDLVGTLIWLASDASNFVTGVVVPVDGGFNAFSGV